MTIEAPRDGLEPILNLFSEESPQEESPSQVFSENNEETKESNPSISLSTYLPPAFVKFLKAKEEFKKSEENFKLFLMRLPPPFQELGARAHAFNLLLRMSPTIHLDEATKSSLLSFGKYLAGDRNTPLVTRNIIFQHFIDILSKERQADHSNENIRQEILESQQAIKNKLNGSPPMSPFLQTALAALIATLAYILLMTLLHAPVLALGLGQILLRSLIFSVPSAGLVGFFACNRQKEYREKQQETDVIVNKIFGPLSSLLAPS
ncbi:MAG: hypothetical protein K0R24_249 [Gammaproteobacteria bacterium]|jgi:hypothetical protein|nr:hypothetical protein [Gammaproteobacteria bacterium]